MINDNETDYAKFLYNKGYIKAPQICKCGNSVFNIYKDSAPKLLNVFLDVQMLNVKIEFQSELILFLMN